MIRIDLVRKLKEAGLSPSREAFLDEYWWEIKDHERESERKNFTPPELSCGIQVTGYLEDILEKVLAGSSDASAYLKRIAEHLGADPKALGQGLILAKPQEIRGLAEKMPRNVFGTPKSPTGLKKDLSAIFDYRKYSEKIAGIFNKLNWAACIYCGRNHLSQLREEDEKIVRGFELDHFHDKANYPYLALSFYNLVPSCSFCNSQALKGNRSIGNISPWSDDYRFHQKVRFKLLTGPDILNDEAQETDKQYEPRISLERKTKDYDHMIEVLKLERAYQLYADQAYAVKQKRDAYPDIHIRKLADVAGLDVKTMKRRLFEPLHHGPTSDQQPLSKLSHDIHDQLGIKAKKDDSIRL